MTPKWLLCDLGIIIFLTIVTVSCLHILFEEIPFWLLFIVATFNGISAAFITNKIVKS